MKRSLITLCVIVLVMILAIPALAATSKKIQEKINVNPTVYNNIYEIHHLVTGQAAVALGHFISNDWDSTSGSLSNLTSEEYAWLNTLYLDAGPVWYIDCTGQTYNTTGFSDYSETVGSSTASTSDFSSTDGRIVSTTTYTTTVTVNNVTYQVVWSGYDSSPIVIDINGDNAIDVAHGKWQKHAPKFYPEYARIFDITGDGSEDFTEWMVPGSNDGLLVKPEGGNVENALQFFGTAGGYLDGYEKLSLECDKDKDGWVAGDELDGLFIWVDANNDARCQAGELGSVRDYGIKKIATRHVNYVSSYESDDGSIKTTWDWWPCVGEVRKFRAQ